MASPSKLRRRMERRKAKEERKAINLAKYGPKVKSSSNKGAGKKHLHLTPFCGNVGCLRCFPDDSERTAKYFAARRAT